jgi:thioredoxin-related protein
MWHSDGSWENMFVNMKRSLIISLLLLCTSFIAMSASWRTDFDQVKKEAAQQHKLIILKFSGSDWCIPCIRMEKEIFNSEAFTHFAESDLLMVNADFPRQKQHQPSKSVMKVNDVLAAQYNKAGHFPMTLLLNEDGKVLKSWDGYTGAAPADLIAQIKSLRK